MAVSGVNGMAIAATAGGALLIWSGIKGASVTSSLKDLISGQQPSGSAANAVSLVDYTGGTSASSSGSPGSNAPNPGSVKGNVALGKMMAAAHGWTGQQWNDLYALWQRESGWSNTAKNPSSGAYGIAQALGHGPTNQYPAGPANPPTSSAAAQIAWGLSYIKQRYGSPSAAWAHETSAGWY